MPAYNAIPAPALYPTDSYTLFSAESTATITTSQQVCLAPDPGTSNTACLVEGFFSGAPGTFELDIQFADTDSNAYYLTVLNGGQVTTVDSTTFHFSQQFSPALGSFLRLKMKTNGNTVNLTAKVTR